MASKHEALFKKYKAVLAPGNIARPKTYFSMGPLSLNLAIGDVRGVPGGRIVQIFGKSSVGKSTLSLDIIRQWQARSEDNVAMCVDFERAYDAGYANNIGVDTSRLAILRADTTEQGLNIVEDAVNNDIKLIIIDSVAAGLPSSELDKHYDDSPKMASNAGLWTRFASRIIPLIDNRDCLIILLNQLRKNFSMMSREEEIPYGGLALQYASSVNIGLQRIKTEDRRITVQATVKKNKVGNPQTRAEFFIDYGFGINHGADIITLAINNGLVNKSGAWYTYDKYKEQGLDNAARNFPLQEIADKMIGSMQTAETTRLSTAGSAEEDGNYV